MLNMLYAMAIVFVHGSGNKINDDAASVPPVIEMQIN